MAVQVLHTYLLRTYEVTAGLLRLVSRKNSILFLPEREVTPESRVLAEVTPDIIFGLVTKCHHPLVLTLFGEALYIYYPRYLRNRMLLARWLMLGGECTC